MNDREFLSSLLSHPWFEQRTGEYYRWYPKSLHAETMPSGNILHTKESFDGVYLHVPFCDQICTFCPYNRRKTNMDQISSFVEGIVSEIKLYRDAFAGSKIRFIYFGGGTPSVLSASQISSILSELRSVSEISNECEISMEIHPTHVTESYLRDLRELGVNRLSTGIQSISQDILSRIGATHTSLQSRIAMEVIPEWFDNWGVDYLYRIPGTDMRHIEHELTEVFSISAPPHVSAYSLFLRNDSAQPCIRVEAEMAVYVEGFMRAHGLEHYCSCATGGYDFAAKDNRCRYELEHWAAPQRAFVGLGPGAFSCSASKISVNYHDLGLYLNSISHGQIPKLASRIVSAEELPHRMYSIGVKALGVDASLLPPQCSDAASTLFGDVLNELAGLDLIARRGSTSFDLTRLGRHFVDQVSEQFWSASESYVEHPETDALQRLERSFLRSQGTT